MVLKLSFDKKKGLNILNIKYQFIHLLIKLFVVMPALVAVYRQLIRNDNKIQ